MRRKVLVVDDDPDILETCQLVLAKEGIEVILKTDGQEALDAIGKESFDLVVSDIQLPGAGGLEVLRGASAAGLPVILMTAHPAMDSALDALRDGATDYLIKPFSPREFVLRCSKVIDERRLRAENKKLSHHMQKGYRPIEIVGSSSQMKEVLTLVDKSAATSANVIILGESGTGKELIARRLHAGSGRKGRFVPVDCGAIPRDLLENEFFGHSKGAFTDAQGEAVGLLELAHDGSFFLDEICELPIDMQSKLFRALQERQIRRVGGKNLVPVDTRIIAATARDIRRELREGRFREELFYRLNVVTIQLPPLRERREDIAALAAHFLQRYAAEFGKSITGLDRDALTSLEEHHWPGNIRELQNTIQSALIVCDGPSLSLRDLPSQLGGPDEKPGAPARTFHDLQDELKGVEKSYLEGLLVKHGGDAKAAARAAGLPLSNFYWHLKKQGLRPGDFRAKPTASD